MLVLRRALPLLAAFSIGYNWPPHPDSRTGTCLGHVDDGGIGCANLREPVLVVLHFLRFAARLPAHYGVGGGGLQFGGWRALAGVDLVSSRRMVRRRLCAMGVCTLLGNGLYLTVDALLHAGGDATSIIALGTPQLYVVGSGIALVALGLVACHLQLPRIGLASSDGFLTRIVVLEGGVGPYLLAMLVYQVCRNRNEITLWLAYVVTGLFMAAGVAVGSRFVEMRWRCRCAVSLTTPSLPITGGYLYAARCVLAAELAVCDVTPCGQHAMQGPGIRDWRATAVTAQFRLDLTAPPPEGTAKDHRAKNSSPIGRAHGVFGNLGPEGAHRRIEAKRARRKLSVAVMRSSVQVRKILAEACASRTHHRHRKTPIAGFGI